MRHSLSLQIGPVAFRIGSAWAAPLDALARLYEGYPEPDGICDFSVRLEPEKPWRRWVKPSVAIQGDYVLPDAAPMALAHGLLAAEMGMNPQTVLLTARHLQVHAHFGGEEPVRARHRRRAGEHIVGRDRHRRQDAARRRALRRE